ncbi:MAG: PIG-L deacetylase family protein [archaeon]
MAKNTIMVFCAHNDDNILGAGGTIAKYTEEGKEVITVIFSYGEGSHPWFQKKVTTAIRVEEAQAAARIIGEKEIIFLGLSDGKLQAETKAAKVQRRLDVLLKRYKPSRIFTHSADELHPDHRAVYGAVLAALDRTRLKPSVFGFPVWHLFSIKERKAPKLYVDISSTFSRKLQGLNAHKSQKVAIYTLAVNTYLKGFLNGLQCESRFAEVFYKLR